MMKSSGGGSMANGTQMPAGSSRMSSTGADCSSGRVGPMWNKGSNPTGNDASSGYSTRGMGMDPTGMNASRGGSAGPNGSGGMGNRATTQTSSMGKTGGRSMRTNPQPTPPPSMGYQGKVGRMR